MREFYQASPAHITSASLEAGGVASTAAQSESTQNSPYPVLGGGGCEKVGVYISMSSSIEFAPQSPENLCELDGRLRRSRASIIIAFLAFLATLP